PGALASLDSVPASSLTTNIWGKIAPRLYDISTLNGRATSMSFTSDTPPPARPTRSNRPNTLAAVAIILAVVVLMGGVFAVFKSRSTPPVVGAKPTATTAPTATIAPTATATVSPNQVTQSDVEALFGAFLP